MFCSFKLKLPNLIIQEFVKLLRSSALPRGVTLQNIYMQRHVAFEWTLKCNATMLSRSSEQKLSMTETHLIT